MPAVAYAVIAIASAYSAYSSYEQGKEQKKANSEMLDKMNAPLPDVSPDTSLADAQAEADKRRMTILTSGGKTDVTAGGAELKPVDAKPKTLLGA